MIADALAAHAAASQREWITDRAQTVGASEIGQCARKTFFSKNEGDRVYGRTRDIDHDDRWGARVRGSVYEDCWWEPALRRAYGARLHLAGPDQTTLVDEFLSATPDGLITGLPKDALSHLGIPDIASECILVECKTADPRTRLDEAKPEHVFQVQVQLGLVRALTRFRPSYGIITYTDTSFWDEVKEFIVEFDEGVFLHARERARAIMLATRAEDIRPEGIISGGRECDLCPFTAACGKQRADRVPSAANSLPSETAATVAALAREAREAKVASSLLEQRARECEHEIRDLLAAADSKRVDHAGLRVIWSPVKGRPSYDNKAIREAAAAAGVDVEKFVTAGDPTDRLVITEVPVSAGHIAA